MNGASGLAVTRHRVPKGHAVAPHGGDLGVPGDGHLSSVALARTLITLVVVGTAVGSVGAAHRLGDREEVETGLICTAAVFLSPSVSYAFYVQRYVRYCTVRYSTVWY